MYDMWFEGRGGAKILKPRKGSWSWRCHHLTIASTFLVGKCAVNGDGEEPKEEQNSYKGCI
jgi:hypothetical protein